jgi:hypothetical protein
MIELKFVASIAERDIDLLIMEELSVSNEFREWFSSRVFGEPIYQSEIGTWHSVSDAQLGESDLIFLFEAVDGPRTAILIENKIDAPPQPQQGQRYRLRGEKGLKEGYWEKFKTCVIAPSKYLISFKHTESYDVEISYEEILAYFQSRSPRDRRFEYKARILLEGIEQNRRGYQPEYNEEMTKFVSDYFAFASEEYAHLGMQEAKPRPAGSTWVMFYPKSLPKEISLVHQLTAGFVKVFFNGQAESFDRLREKYSSKLPDDASIDIAGKSVAISMKVPKVDPLSIPFSEQLEKIKLALQSLSSLEKLVATNGGI